MQLALGVAGAGIGSMFGYASIGWSIGSFIGGQLFPSGGQDIQGPRITDKTVTTSAYGEMLPIDYASYRLGGNVIWQTDRKEHAHKEEAGKGGGGGSYTTYTYTISFALALCKRQIVGVRKMWFDGKLVYSVAEDATAAELQASEKLSKKITIYTGTTTQTADPTMEAEEGAGNVPGYRGTAYIVFENLDVTKYGGRIPQITCEVVADGSFSLTGDQISSGGASLRQSLHISNGVARVFYYDYSWDGTQASLGRFEQRAISLEDFTEKQVKSAYAVAGGNESFGWRYLYPVSISPKRKYYIAEGGDAGTGANIQYYLLTQNGGVLSNGGLLRIVGDLDNYKNGDDVSFNLIWEDDNNLWFYKFNSGDVYHWTFRNNPLGGVYISQDVFNVDSTRSGLDPTDNYGSFCIDRASGDIYVEIETNEGTPQYSIKRYTRDGTFVEEKFVGTQWRSVPSRIMGFSSGVLWEGSVLNLKRYDWETETLISSNAIATDVTYIDQAIMEVSGNIAVIAAQGVLYPFKVSLTRSSTGLDDVVSDICTRAGMDVGDIDVTALASDTVRGFLIGKQEPARAALEQLSAAYFFDGVETDGVLKFVKRGGAVAATLDDDDIGCYEGDNVVELWEATRTQEEELPQALTLNYANVGADYQVGAQQAKRQVTLDGTEVTTQVSIALSDDEAKEIVETWMFSIWQNRHKFTLNTWQKYAKLDPTDVISAHGETMLIVDRNEGVNGLIELKTVRELPEIYTGQVGAGATSGHTSQSVIVEGETEYLLLDIPPLRDADYNTYGIYVAATGLLSGWSGYALMRSSDGGNTWSVEMTNDTASVIGQAGTALGDWTGGNVFDEKNVLRVTVIGTLESKTRTQVLDGSNLALVGDELIQFRTATLVSTGVYDLSGLLRGRMGTEWAMDSHADYEDFVLLDSSSTRFVDLSSTDFNVERLWGAVTYGDTVEDITTTSLTYAGENIKPLVPVHIGGGTAGTNTDWTIKWKKRSRFEWQWRDYLDVSDDESSDDFEVRIYDGATVKRTISVTNAETTTYTYAQQVTDFSGYQNTIDVSVRQIGASRNSEWSDIFTLDSGQAVILSTSLLHLNGANGSTTITDVYSPTWTAFGNAALSTTSSKFGSACLLLDGTGDYIKSTSITSLGSLPWCIEGWFRWETLPGVGVYSAIFAPVNASGYGITLFLANSGGTRRLEIYMSSTGSSHDITAGSIGTNTTWSAATYYHIALVFTGTAYKIYVDGVQDLNITNSSTICAITQLYYGSSNGGGDYFNGRIDETRITLGDSRYTGAFTPSSSEFTE